MRGNIGLIRLQINNKHVQQLPPTNDTMQHIYDDIPLRLYAASPVQSTVEASSLRSRMHCYISFMFVQYGIGRLSVLNSIAVVHENAEPTLPKAVSHQARHSAAGPSSSTILRAASTNLHERQTSNISVWHSCSPVLSYRQSSPFIWFFFRS